MQAISWLPVVTLVVAAITLLGIVFLTLQNRVPQEFQQVPEHLSRLENLYAPMASSMRDGFRESRIESVAAINGIRDTLDRNLSELRNETSNLNTQVSTQIGSLHATVVEHLAGLSSTTSERIHEFIATISGKLDSTNSLVRSEIQSHMQSLQTTLTGGFSDFIGNTNDAFAALQLMITGKLDNVLSTAISQHEVFRLALEGSFSSFQTEMTNTLHQSENRQTTNNAALQELVQTTLSGLSSQLNENLEFQRRQLGDLADKTAAALRIVKESVDLNLKTIADSNEKKLEQMRETVDEKLHSTLERRLTESFSIVSDHLSKVQTGLGEMKDLATSVGDLKRIFSNVKSRGGFAEIQLGAQLENVLAPNQYRANVRVKPETTESVEFAICLPGNNGEECLLPIDAKFPREAWERLESAREKADAEETRRASDGFESSIRTEAKRISEKYINPPVTTNFAYMYLPTEALFAEVVRNPGLLEELQMKYRVSVAGPTTLMALLISFQMGFQTLAIQKKGSEVWNILVATKVQFGKFGGLMTRVEKNVGTIQNTLHDIGVRTRAINRALSTVDAHQPQAINTTELSELLQDENDKNLAQGAAAGQDNPT